MYMCCSTYNVYMYVQLYPQGIEALHCMRTARRKRLHSPFIILHATVPISHK